MNYPSRRLLPHFCHLAAWLAVSLVGCVSAQRTGSPAGGGSGGASIASGSGKISLPPADAAAIGRKIWQNECSGTIEGLVSWNAGEDFASLGIGHFIWYVAGRPGPFEESFPRLITYLKQRQVPGMPAWLSGTRGCPWPSREAFLASQSDPQVLDLRRFLADTVGYQTDFIVARLEQALPKMEGATGSGDRDRLRTNFYKVAQSRQGVYALIDYVNFKGEGVKAEEKYQGQGWGLRDVLLTMSDTPGGAAAAHEFGEAAKRVLSNRVKNSPPARGESRWLPGWLNRCATYQRPL